MTTNQTIDGVPRAALMTVLSEPRPGAPHCVLEARAVLCALLDAPAHVHEWDINAEGTATVCHCGARSSDEPSTNPQDKASLLDPYDGGTFVESTPNGCENCAMDLSTCDCVEPKPVRWTYSPSRGSKSTPQGEPVAFQDRVKPWMLECFGEVIAADSQERNHRFLEEALELVQACGCTATEAHQLVEYVYGRPVGEPSQEVGGVMVTLAALCLAHGLDMHASGETELARIWTKVEQIRAKQAAKPAMSPLPGAYPDREQPAPVAVVLSADELRFLEAISLNPGAKLNGGIAWSEEGDSMWGRLEELGLIECVGGYKWKLAFNAVELGVKAFLGNAAPAQTPRPAHANPPPGAEPCGTHHDNDGLDDYRNTK